MSSDTCPIILDGVWKKYSRNEVFHRSLREDIVRVFRPRRQSAQDGLDENEFWALQNINLAVRRGEAVGLYGHNGAGKSTILKLLSGVTYPNKGEVVTSGRVAPLIEVGAGFHPDLTGRENVFVNGAILGMGISEIRKKFDSILDFSELTGFIDMPVKKYSSGMYLRLAFSIAIHSDADIFLIDEIISVGDEEFQAKCIHKIMKLKEKNKTLILVSHDMSLLKRLSSRIIFLSKGTVDQELALSSAFL